MLPRPDALRKNGGGGIKPRVLTAKAPRPFSRERRLGISPRREGLLASGCPAAPQGRHPTLRAFPPALSAPGQWLRCGFRHRLQLRGSDGLAPSSLAPTGTFRSVSYSAG